MLKSPPRWQMLARVSLPQQWLMTTWNKQTSTILARKPVGVIFQTRNITELQKGLYVNCRDFLSRSFRRRNWYYVAQLKTSSFSRHLSKPCLEKPKRGNLELERPTSEPPKSKFSPKQMKIRGRKCSRKCHLPGKKRFFEQKMALTCIYNNTGII